MSPAVANGIVYFPSGDYNLYALDGNTGAQNWNDTVRNGFGSSTPSVANGVIYIGNIWGDLMALDAATGAAKWNGHPSDYTSNTPAIANGIAYTTDQLGNSVRP